MGRIFLVNEEDVVTLNLWNPMSQIWHLTSNLAQTLVLRTPLPAFANFERKVGPSTVNSLL